MKKNYPQLLIDKTTNRPGSIRGGGLVEIAELLFLLSEKGTWIGVTCGIFIVGWDKIPRTKLSVISEHLRKGLPVTYSNYEINYDKKFG